MCVTCIGASIFILTLNHADEIGDQSDGVTQNAWFRCTLCAAISGEISILIQTGAESWGRFPVPRICSWESRLHDKNIDITFLQETHCVSSKAKIISSSWLGKMFHGLSESSASRGVAILVHKNLRCNTLNYKQDKDGRILIVNTEIDNQIFSFVLLYAPNDEYN